MSLQSYQWSSVDDGSRDIRDTEDMLNRLSECLGGFPAASACQGSIGEMDVGYCDSKNQQEWLTRILQGISFKKLRIAHNLSAGNMTYVLFL